MSKSENLGLSALLKNLRHDLMIQIMSVRHNVIPGEVMWEELRPNLFFKINGHVTLQQIMNNEMGVFSLSCHLDRSEPSLFISQSRKFRCMIQES